MNQGPTIVINAEVQGIDENLEKVKRYVELLTEANELAAELASVNFQVNFLT